MLTVPSRQCIQHMAPHVSSNVTSCETIGGYRGQRGPSTFSTYQKYFIFTTWIFIIVRNDWLADRPNIATYLDAPLVTYIQKLLHINDENVAALLFQAMLLCHILVANHDKIILHFSVCLYFLVYAQWLDLFA